MRSFFLYDVASCLKDLRELYLAPSDTLYATDIMSANYENARARLFRKHSSPVIVVGIEEKANTDENCRLTDNVYEVRESNDSRIGGTMTFTEFRLFQLGLEKAGIRTSSILDLAK